MQTEPIVSTTMHRIRFSELDPYDHLNTGACATYYTDHRFEGLREHLGWDLRTLGTLPFMIWVRRIDIEFLRPIRGDQKITITSSVREIRGPDAVVDCTMIDSVGKHASRCVMTVAYVDKQTNRSADWPAAIRELIFEAKTA